MLTMVVVLSLLKAVDLNQWEHMELDSHTYMALPLLSLGRWGWTEILIHYLFPIAVVFVYELHFPSRYLRSAKVWGFLSRTPLIVPALKNLWMKNCFNVSSLSIVSTKRVYTKSNLLMYPKISSPFLCSDEANAFKAMLWPTSSLNSITNSPLHLLPLSKMTL